MNKKHQTWAEFATMSGEAFELVRRVGGSRILYQVRTATGKFKTVPGVTYEEALLGAESNVANDLALGLYDVDDVVEFERQNPFEANNDPVEIQLDEIELNEHDPLLETAPTGLVETGFTSAAGAASAPSSSAIAAGILTGAGIVAGGITAGVLSNNNNDNDDDEHTNPVFSLPGHKYIGPGNTITNIQPIDEDDHIAYDHDIAYEKAKTQKDIQRGQGRG